jgi:hypothetical protein
MGALTRTNAAVASRAESAIRHELPASARHGLCFALLVTRRAISAAMRGNLVGQTAGSRRAVLDVLRPVTPTAQRRCQRF